MLRIFKEKRGPFFPFEFGVRFQWAVKGFFVGWSSRLFKETGGYSSPIPRKKKEKAKGEKKAKECRELANSAYRKKLLKFFLF